MTEHEHDSSTDDIKAKMAEALDRKHAGEHGGEAHLDGHGKAEHAHGKEGGQKQFRRKAI